jgi:hypothetical protein
MTSENANRWKEVAGQVRAKAIFCIFPTIMFSSFLAAAIWNPHSRLNDFYPLPLAVWGLLTLWISRAAFVYLNQLSWAISAEETATKRRKARRLKVFILCTMLISCCFMMSLLAAKSFGRLYALAAVLFGISMISMALITEREIKRLAVWFTSPTDSIAPLTPG